MGCFESGEGNQPSSNVAIQAHGVLTRAVSTDIFFFILIRATIKSAFDSLILGSLG